jgi:hypothetical protein
MSGLASPPAFAKRSLATASGNPRESLFTEPPVVSADGRAYAYTYATVTSDLFVVDGAR